MEVLSKDEVDKKTLEQFNMLYVYNEVEMFSIIKNMIKPNIEPDIFDSRDPVKVKFWIIDEGVKDGVLYRYNYFGNDYKEYIKKMKDMKNE